jgi:hypothetical protein
LAATGLGQDFIKTKAVTVVRDTESVLHIIVPHEVNKKREDDDAYLEELGFVVIMGCK